MDQNDMKKEILDYQPELEVEEENHNDRFHILSDEEVDSLFEEENPLDSTTTLNEIASMDFDDYEVVKEKENIIPQVVVEKKEKVSRKTSIFSNYRLRLILSFSLIILLFFVSIGIFLGSISHSPSKDISYSEDSNIQYKVYLKENDVYKNEYLDENMTYISSLIKLIKVKMNYQFTISEKANVDYGYSIIANMMIVDKNDPNKIYYNDKSILLEETLDTMEQDTTISINPEVSIDYDYYNDISNRFRFSYGFETNNYIVVSLCVHEVSDSPYQFSQTSTPSIQIPLSAESIQIQIDNIKNEKKIEADKHYPIKSLFQFFLGFGLGVVSMIVLVKFFKQFIETERKKRLSVVKRYEKKKNLSDD